jgi:hypothetical protein
MPHQRRPTPSFTVEIKRSARRKAQVSAVPVSSSEENASLAESVFGSRRWLASSTLAATAAASSPLTAAAPDPAMSVPYPQHEPRVLPDLRAQQRELGSPVETGTRAKPGRSSEPQEVSVTEQAIDEPDVPVALDAASATATQDAVAASPQSQNPAPPRHGATKAEQRRIKRAAARKAKRLGLAEVPLPPGQRWRKRRLPPSCW